MFIPISDHIIRISVKTHFATIVAVHATVNPPNATSDAHAPSEAYYDALHYPLLPAVI
jgi:hypothetical protein